VNADRPLLFHLPSLAYARALCAARVNDHSAA
jgi:hypothetical protein